MYVKHKVNVKIFEDSAGKNYYFGPDDTLAEITLSGHTQQSSNTLNIAASGTEALTFGDVGQVYGLYMRVDKSCEVTIDGADTPITVTPQTDSATNSYAKLFLQATITSVSITNTDSANALTGFYVVWGDAS